MLYILPFKFEHKRLKLIARLKVSDSGDIKISFEYFDVSLIVIVTLSNDFKVILCYVIASR